MPGEKPSYLRNRRIFSCGKNALRDTPKGEENLKVQMEIIALENKTQTNKLKNKMQQKNRKQNKIGQHELKNYFICSANAHV